MEKYDLAGIDGNAFSIMGYVVSCMKKEHKTKEEIDTYLHEAQSSDYDNLVYVSCDIINVLNKLN